MREREREGERERERLPFREATETRPGCERGTERAAATTEGGRERGFVSSVFERAVHQVRVCECVCCGCERERFQ